MINNDLISKQDIISNLKLALGCNKCGLAAKGWCNTKHCTFKLLFNIINNVKSYKIEDMTEGGK